MKAFTTATAVLASTGAAFGALTQVTGFGTNPTGLQMYVSVPAKITTNPAIIVALHPCGGTASEWYSGTRLPASSESLGFVLIYPQTTKFSNCWDVNNAATLTHGAGGDSAGIISMVNYALTKYHGDKTKVFVMGGSSGAMMANVMIGSYPEVFEAGAAYSGTAFACFAGSKSDPTPFGANQTCAQGLSHTPEQWASYVKNAYPSYMGKRPRFLVAHGLADTLVRPAAGYEQLKQWSAVLGVTNTANQTGAGVDQGSQYNKMMYGTTNQLVGYFGQGVGHIAPVVEGVLLKFFGLQM
ncbi:Alpha/Beta hydrolase protein [Ampelomyces quisqualis]|uniref:Carboxylic ester hydrolase n=1 Tax=Ampelomyces quisqualis TaxID=50730 RepID=A0A6A5QPD3_AMPQU|nr:Alpha/Beta hydrolase protein [Ampelomyces quisqualis]